MLATSSSSIRGQQKPLVCNQEIYLDHESNLFFQFEIYSDGTRSTQEIEKSQQSVSISKTTNDEQKDTYHLQNQKWWLQFLPALPTVIELDKPTDNDNQKSAST